MGGDGGGAAVGAESEQGQGGEGAASEDCGLGAGEGRTGWREGGSACEDRRGKPYVVLPSLRADDGIDEAWSRPCRLHARFEPALSAVAETSFHSGLIGDSTTMDGEQACRCSELAAEVTAKDEALAKLKLALDATVTQRNQVSLPLRTVIGVIAILCYVILRSYGPTGP